MDCLSDTMVARLVEGIASPTERLDATSHLDQCAACRAIVAPALGDAPATVAGPSDRYILRRELIRGGMGQIWLAYDKALGREVALKCPRQELAHTHRFAQEVAVLTALSHPAIVPILDAGWLDSATPYFAMPLLQGRPLDRFVTKAQLSSRLQCVRRLSSVVEAVAHAHSLGILHRDIKPQNIFMGDFGECLLLDWGLAKQTGRPDAGASDIRHVSPVLVYDATAQTQTGHGMGTPGFAAPEQMAGQACDERADVYGLGCVLYFVLTGGAVTADAANHLAEAGVPRDLSTVILRAMAFAPADRYASARELAQELERFFAGAMVEAYEYSAQERVWRFIRTHNTAFVVGAVAIALLAAAGSFFLHRVTTERDVAMAATERAWGERRRARQLADLALTDVAETLGNTEQFDVMLQFASALEAELETDSPLGLPTSDRGEEAMTSARLAYLLAQIQAERLELNAGRRYVARALHELNEAESSAASPLEIGLLRAKVWRKQWELQFEVSREDAMAALASSRAAVEALLVMPWVARDVYAFYARLLVTYARQASNRGDYGGALNELALADAAWRKYAATSEAATMDLYFSIAAEQTRALLGLQRVGEAVDAAAAAVAQLRAVPRERDRRSNQAIALLAIAGRAIARNDHHEEGLALMRESYALQKEALLGGKESVVALNELRRVAREIARYTDDNTEALQLGRDGVDIGRKLVALTATTETKHELASELLSLAKRQGSAGRAMCDEALGIMAGLDANNAIIVRNHSVMLVDCAALDEVAGDRVRARTRRAEAVRHAHAAFSMKAIPATQLGYTKAVTEWLRSASRIEWVEMASHVAAAKALLAKAQSPVEKELAAIFASNVHRVRGW